MKTKIKNLTKYLGEYILLPFILLVIVLIICGLLLNVIVEDGGGIFLGLIIIAPFGLYLVRDTINLKLFFLNYFLIFFVLLLLVWWLQSGVIMGVVFVIGNLIHYFKRGEDK